MTAETTIGVPESTRAVPEKVDRRARDRSSTGAPPHTAGMLWFAGWLFTISFAKLVWWKAVLALVVWPYFLGATLR